MKLSKESLKDSTLKQLIFKYTNIGLLQSEALSVEDSRKYNRIYDEWQDVEREIKSRGLDGIAELRRLYEHPNWQVRLNAARATIFDAPVESQLVLERIVESKHFPQAAEASMALRLLEEGTWKSD